MLARKSDAKPNVGQKSLPEKRKKSFRNPYLRNPPVPKDKVGKDRAVRYDF